MAAIGSVSHFEEKSPPKVTQEELAQLAAFVKGVGGRSRAIDILHRHPVKFWKPAYLQAAKVIAKAGRPTLPKNSCYEMSELYLARLASISARTGIKFEPAIRPPENRHFLPSRHRFSAFLREIQWSQVQSG